MICFRGPKNLHSNRSCAQPRYQTSKSNHKAFHDAFTLAPSTRTPSHIMSPPTQHPTRRREIATQPIWGSAALKSLYRDRSLDTAKQPSKTHISRLRRMFAGQSVGENRLMKWREQVVPETRANEKRARWKVIKPYDEHHDSELVGSTSAKVGSRTRGSEVSVESKRSSNGESFASSCTPASDGQSSVNEVTFSRRGSAPLVPAKGKALRMTGKRKTTSRTPSEPSSRSQSNTTERRSVVEGTSEFPSRAVKSGKSDAHPSQPSLGMTKITTRDVAVSMGLQTANEATANGSNVSTRHVSSQIGGSHSSHASPKSTHSSRCSKLASQHSPAKIVAKREEAVQTEPEPEPEPETRVESEVALEELPLSASEVRQKPQTDRTQSVSSDRPILSMPPHGDARSGTPAQGAASSTFSQQPSRVSHDRPQRVSLTSLSHMPRKDLHQGSSSGRTRKRNKKQKKKEKKLEYHFDSERGVLIRTGLYDEEYRPKEEKGAREPDIWQRILDARIWTKMAALVLW